jgi:hypothetical protein
MERLPKSVDGVILRPQQLFSGLILTHRYGLLGLTSNYDSPGDIRMFAAR